MNKSSFCVEVDELSTIRIIMNVHVVKQTG